MLALAGIALFLAILIVNTAYADELENGDERKGNTIKTQSLPAALVNADSEGIVTADLNTGISPEDLVYSLLGGGVVVSNVTFTGVNIAAGTFSGGADIIGFEDGIILSTGNVSNVIGPNEFDDISKVNGFPGDPDLDALIPAFSTFDATVLEFDFIPAAPIIQFEYVFSSDEYNEYVNTEFNDVFGFFVNAENIALIPGTSIPVSINNVNNGNPLGTNSSNPDYYINNDLDDGGGLINTEMDGLTIVLTATADVSQGELNHIKLAIADAGDSSLDSDVILRAESFVSPRLILEPAFATNEVGEIHTLIATLVDAAGAPMEGETITFNVTEGPHVGVLGTDVTDFDGIAVLNYTVETPGNDTIVATGGGQSSNKVTKKWIGAGVLRLTLEPESSTNVPGSIHTLKATLVDAAGAPIAGETINFNVTSGPYAGTRGTGISDANGTAFWSYGISPGMDTIVATGGGQTSNEAFKTWEMSAGNRLSLEPGSSVNAIGNFHVLRATLIDEDGMPVGGELVSFTVMDGPHHGLWGTALSDSEGTATWCYFGMKPGNDTIVALGGEQASNKVFKTWKTSLSKLTLSPKSATNTVGESHALTVRLVNETGSPIAGELISFNVSSGPHAGTSGTGITDSNGTATWNYTGVDSGNDTIVATNGRAGSNEVFKTWEKSLPSESLSEMGEYMSNVFTKLLARIHS
ncbi:MAG: choice-of-anchor L domain-containing protein [Methanosarcinaceae archaeon]|nr:choice-of-anchor L domain-containing protein [Methanosarcinaceae archaeon]